jgi:thioester reductase-like protein
MNGELFMTGVTGYIGSSLLKKYLDDTDMAISLLVRGRRDRSPADRLRAVLEDLYPEAGAGAFDGRIRVLEGDIAVERLGLKEKDYGELATRTARIIHCAAAARFDLDLEDARRINVGGTRNMLAMARECPGLEKFDYIGTAYVCGSREGLILEDELDKGQDHRNTYERSKMEAEKLVRGYFGEMPITVMRPSIVICDSKTGRASDFNGFYRALRLYWQGLVKMLPGDPSCRMDLVPVDYVTDAVFALSGCAASAGNCYHLTAGADRAASLAEIRDLAAEHFGRKPFTIIPPDDFLAWLSGMERDMTDGEKRITDELKLYMPYLGTKMSFDDSATLRDTGLEPPRVGDYFGAMARYIMDRESPGPA